MPAGRGYRAFTWEEIRAIRARYMAGDSQSTLAREYHVAINTIGRIVRGESYIENSRTRIEQPQTPRYDFQADDPQSRQEMIDRIAAGLRAQGVDIPVNEEGEADSNNQLCDGQDGIS